MALGGGGFTAQDKGLPGAYINFVSAASASAALSDRGIVTMPLELDWGREREMFGVSSGEFRECCMELFGYPYTHEKMKGLRDLFLNAQTLYCYRLNGNGAKASNQYAEARYGGVRGNDLKIIIQANADDSAMFDVKTMLGASVVDEQKVAGAGGLADNKYVKWKAGAELEPTAAAPLEGGTNGEVEGEAYQAYLDAAEGYSFNIMGTVVGDSTTKALFASFVKRMRDEVGIKFQLVLHGYAKADYCGTVSVKNSTKDVGWGAGSLVYWAAGALAGCEVNRSCQNRVYDGEFSVDASYTQGELRKAIAAGEFVLHKVGTDVRVLKDINTMATATDTQGEAFKENQTIRVMEQIGNDIAVLFNTKYLGAVPNNAAGRVSLWSDIVAHHRELEQVQAIEGFSDGDVVVQQGSTKKSVVVADAVTVVNAMDKLYMVCTIS